MKFLEIKAYTSFIKNSMTPMTIGIQFGESLLKPFWLNLMMQTNEESNDFKQNMDKFMGKFSYGSARRSIN